MYVSRKNPPGKGADAGQVQDEHLARIIAIIAALPTSTNVGVLENQFHSKICLVTRAATPMWGCVLLHHLLQTRAIAAGALT